MSELSYKGAIHASLLKLFKIDDGFTIGEKITQIEKTFSKKKGVQYRILHISDEELLNTIDELIKIDYYTDEPIDAE